MLNRFKIPLVALALLLAATASVVLLKQIEPTPLEFDSSMGIPVMSPPIPLPEVNLVDQHNQPFQTSTLKGSWNLLFFGFTNCPDVCPTTLNNLKQAAKQLSQQPIRYIFVSLDPNRDSPEKLKDYMNFFNPEFTALTGNKAEIDRLSEALGVIYDYEGDTSSDDYSVNHYAAILVVDPQARLRAHILPPHSASKIVTGISLIMDYYGN